MDHQHEHNVHHLIHHQEYDVDKCNIIVLPSAHSFYQVYLYHCLVTHNIDKIKFYASQHYWIAK